MERELVQLPNGDLWRPNSMEVTELAKAESVKVEEESMDPVNRAMAAILKTSKGANDLTCNWCGFQSDEKSIRKHVRTVHATAIGLDRPSDAQVLTAQLEHTKQELRLERAKE